MLPLSAVDLNSRLTSARIRLALRQPFLASALMRLPLINAGSVSWCPTMSTDGFHIFYNPHWVSGLSDAELRGVIAHELLHVIFAHAARRGGRDRQVWNCACDFSINLLLKELGFRLPEEGLFCDEFMGMTAEQVYDKLAQSIRPKGSSEGPSRVHDLDVPGLLPTVGPDLLDPDDPRASSLRPPDSPDAEQIRNLSAELRAEGAARLSGKVGAWFQLECEAADNAQVDWRAILRSWLYDRMRSDWSMWPPSKRHIHRGLLLPSVGVEAPAHIVFAIDTSGSMSLTDLATVYAEVRSFRETFPCSMSVVQSDTAIKFVEEYSELDDSTPAKQFKVVGRGGTDFRCVFEWMQKRLDSTLPHTSALIFATDGYGTFPANPPDWPVIWLRTQLGAPKERFPFGLVVSL